MEQDVEESRRFNERKRSLGKGSQNFTKKRGTITKEVTRGTTSEEEEMSSVRDQLAGRVEEIMEENVGIKVRQFVMDVVSHDITRMLVQTLDRKSVV